MFVSLIHLYAIVALAMKNTVKCSEKNKTQLQTWSVGKVN